MPSPYDDRYRTRAVERYETTNLTSAQVAVWMGESYPDLPAPSGHSIRVWACWRRQFEEMRATDGRLRHSSTR